MAKRTQRPPLRIGDPVPPDEVKWLLAFRALPKEQQRAVGECIRNMPPGISPMSAANGFSERNCMSPSSMRCGRPSIHVSRR